MRIATIIVNYRTPELVLRCLEALNSERALLPDLEVFVVDNASSDGSPAVLSAAIQRPPLSKWVTFLSLPLNGGFGWGNNQAILHVLQNNAPPDAFYLLNPDTVIEHGALHALVACLRRHANAGAAGSQLLNTDRTLAGSAFRFPTIAREFIRGLGVGLVGRILGIKPVLCPYGVEGPVDWVTGASVLIRTEALKDAGLFDTGFFLYFEEVELMYRMAQHGWRAYHCPLSRVVHVAGASTGIVDGKTDGDRVPPDYVFHSRRRFFSLTGGKRLALLANLAWLVGDALSLIVSLFARSRRSAVSGERRALLRTGLRARQEDTLSAIEQLHDKPGRVPSWMNQ
jgi:N-acetylglucosaminyl-diphospho-decaprenol L-rhamnosyltransferase